MSYSNEIQIEVSRHVSIPKSQLPPAVNRFLRDKLFILNSEYIIKERLGKSTYDVPKFFNLIEKTTSEVHVPRGFLGNLTAFLDKEDIAYKVTWHYPQFGSQQYNNAIILTIDQERMVSETMAAGQGILVAPPGSGKTIMGLDMIAKHGKPALILTHRKQLLDQWVEQIQKYLNIPKKQIGRYSSAYKKPGEQITVGLLQSFARAKNLDDFANAFGVIIVDECHHIPAKTFRSVVSQLNAERIYGLTATPKRKHNDEKLIYYYIGDIVATANPDAAVVNTSGDVKSGFAIDIRTTSLVLPFDWKTDRAELLAKVICYDTARNRQIVQDITKQTALGRKTLVLSERKEHLQILELYLRDQCKTIVFSGDDSAKSRTTKLQQIKDGDYEVLLATGQIFGEGMHVENIATLVLAFPFSFEGKLTQYIGRLLHSTAPRQLIDYHDTHVAVLDKQAKQRQRYYSKIHRG